MSGTFIALAFVGVGSAAAALPVAQSLPGVPPSWLAPPVVARLSPAALVARAKSADQFRGESAAAALVTAQTVFPRLMSAPVWRGPALPPGSHVHGYLSSTTAQVATPNTGRLGLLESSTPLLGRTPSGQSAPVDLGLVAGAGGFVPVSAAVAVQIPASTAAPVVFPGSGIAIGLPGVGAAISAVVSKDRAYYASVSTDEDVSVNAVPQGAEVSVLLRSPAAATTVPLSFVLPSGATLRITGPTDPQPPGSVAIEQGTSTIGVVEAASGMDAQGQAVGVTYSLKDSTTLLMHVQLPAQVAWPVAIDPNMYVLDSYPGPETTNAYTCWNDWGWSSNVPTKMYPLIATFSQSAPNSMFDVTGPGIYYPAGAFGECYRLPRANSYVYAASFYNTSLQLAGGSASYMVQGIEGLFDPTTSFYAAGGWVDQHTGQAGATGFAVRSWGLHTGDVTNYCATPCVPSSAVHDGTFPFFQLEFQYQTMTGAAYPYSGISNASLFSSDNDPPVITANSESPALPTGWVKSVSAASTVSATDMGLGLSQLAISGTGIVAQPGTPGLTSTIACTGSSASPCPLAYTTPTAISWQTTSNTPDGIDKVIATATDIVNNVSVGTSPPNTQQIKIDNTPPVFGAFAGTLVAAAGQAPSILTSSVYGLSVPVSDATAGVAHTTITITPQGGTPQTVDEVNPNGADGAGMTATYAFNTAQHPRGVNTIVLTGYDRAGNQMSSQTFTVDSDPSQGSQGDYSYRNQALDDRMTLSENIGSGESLLSANDVAIAGPAGFGIALTRSYNSIETADATDLSPGWRFSIGGDVHLDTAGLPAGQIRYYGPTGETGIFVPSGANSYTDVATIPAHLTSNPDGTFTLSFYLNSATDTFGAPNDSGRMNLQRETDRNGNAVTIAYQGTTGAAANMMTQVTETPNYPAAVSRSVTVHYLGSQISEIDDQTGRAWLYGYTSGRLSQYTDPAGGVTHYGYDAAGLLNSITDPLGSITTVVYQTDGSARVATVTQPDGTTPEQVTGFAYPAGTGGYDETDITDPNGYTAHNQITSASTTPVARVGEVASSTDPTGVQSSHAFNANGRPSSGDVSGSGALTTTHYMPDGYRPDTITDPNTATTLIHYPSTGNTFLPDTVTTAQKNKLNLGYDGSGNLSSVTDSATPAAHQPLNLSYHSDGVLASSTDVDAAGVGHLTSYPQNTSGDMTEADPPSPLGHTAYTPDTLGRLSSTTDGAGRTTAFTYDLLDRVLTATYTDSVPSDRTVLTYTYDKNGNQLTLVDPSGTTIYTPDLANRLVNVARPDGTQASYGYDKDNDLASTADGLATSEAFSYDHADRLSQVTYINGSYTENYNYAYTFGTAQSGTQPLTQKTITYPNSIVATSTYTSGLVADLKYTGTAGTLRDFQYAYANDVSCGVAASQELIGQVTDQNQHSTRYCYDTLDRLTHATTYAADGVTVLHDYQYAYDPSGNRTSQTVDGATTAYAYNGANELTSATPSGGTARTFSYDGAGNQQTDSTGYSATYNALSQTTGLQQGINSLANTYTSAGQAQRTHASGETTYANTLLGVTSASANPPLGVLDFQSNGLANGQSSFIRDPSGNLLGLTTNTPGVLGNTVTHYTYATDQQGSVSAVYTSGQTQAAGYTYDPYGNTTTASGGTTTSPFTFQGQYQDTTGLYHMGQRYYDPTSGRWTQQDPSSDFTHANRYSYAGDNAVDFADPSGLCFVLDCDAYHAAGNVASGALHGAVNGAEEGFIGGLVSGDPIGGAVAGAGTGALSGGAIAAADEISPGSGKYVDDAIKIHDIYKNLKDVYNG